MEFVRIASQGLISSETEEFVLYVSTLIIFGGIAIIVLVLRNEYIPYLIRLSKLKEYIFITVFFSVSHNAVRVASIALITLWTTIPILNMILAWIPLWGMRFLTMGSLKGYFQVLQATLRLDLLEKNILWYFTVHTFLGEVFRRCRNIMGPYVKDTYPLSRHLGWCAKARYKISSYGGYEILHAYPGPRVPV